MAIATILAADRLSKHYRSPSGRLMALDDLSFSVRQGEFLCIVGPSGCGKTTLLQLLGGLEQPTAGDVFLDDLPLLGPHPDISIVFQKPNLMPWRTVLENVMLPLTILNGRNKVRQRSEAMLEKVGLSDFAQSYPKELSGGMEQRVAVARALVRHPRVLLLDEPFSALDELTREKLNLELLALWRHQNITAVMVTHNIREAVLLADRVLVLSSRPACLAAEFPIDLARPRHQRLEYTPEFVETAFRIRQSIRE
jgi:NitT/TauT family transport system ATP-binding protein